MQAKFQKIGLITKQNVAQRLPFVKSLMDWLKTQNKTVLIDENISKALKKKGGLEKSKMLKKADMVIVLGGDGTLLKTARNLSKKKRTPVLGINLGTLGFLTETTPSKLLQILKRIFEGYYCLDERFLLRVTIYRKGKKRYTSLALNDAVINQGGFARLVNLLVEVNQKELALYRADGLIISTPTGSTGHSLSAGGPIIHPKIDSLVITPLCPVKLGFRPIVIPSDRILSVKLETEWRAEKKPVVLTIDGQVTFNLKLGDVIKLRKSGRVFQLMRAPGHRYYKMLRQKLNWGA